MISGEQKNEVRQYLLSKKLPLDILIEVEDHVINQLEEVLLRNKVSFEDAFMQVKGLWQEDLQTEKYYNGNEIASFAKKIKDRETSKAFRKALLSVFLYVGFTFALSKIISKELFLHYFSYHFYLFWLVAVVFYLMNYKIYKKVHKYKSTKFSVFQNSIFFLSFSSVVFYFIAGNFSFYGAGILDFFNGNIDNFTFLVVIMIVALFYFFGFYQELKFVNVMNKLKDRLVGFNIQF